MAITPKTKKPVSSRSNATPKPKGIVASKKKGLSKKQWGIIAAVGVLVLAIGGYFGFQYYQDVSPNAASGWTKVASNGMVPNDPRNSLTAAQKKENAKNYSKWTIYACHTGNTVRAKTTVTDIAGSYKGNVINSEVYALTGVGSSKGNTGVKATKSGVSGISKKYTTTKSQVYASGSAGDNGYFTTMNGSRYKVTIDNLAKCQ